MWYILQVTAGREAYMKEKLKHFLKQNAVRDIFFPLYESSYKKNGVRRIVTKILFPGYLFLDVAQEGENRELTQCLEGITESLRPLTERGVCIPVSREEQAFLTKHTDMRHIMRMSRGYMVNQEVTITEGAFIGYRGKLKYVDRHKRYGVMAVRLGEREIDMQFGLEIIEKISA